MLEFGAVRCVLRGNDTKLFGATHHFSQLWYIASARFVLVSPLPHSPLFGLRSVDALPWGSNYIPHLLPNYPGRISRNIALSPQPENLCSIGLDFQLSTQSIFLFTIC